MKMPPMFWSKIFVESHDSGFDAIEATYEGTVLGMVEQIKRNLVNLEPIDLPIHFANTIDKF